MVDAGALVFHVYTGLFTAFSVVVLVFLFRKRNDFYLQSRFPSLLMVQLVCCVLMPISGQFVSYSADSDVRCFARTLSLLTGNGANLGIVLRTWWLFWQIYLGRYLSESRKRFNLLLRRCSTDSIIVADVEKQDIKDRALRRGKEQRLIFLKYSIPGVITFFSCLHAVALIIDYAAFQSICVETGSRFALIETLMWPVIILQTVLTASIAWVIRKFRDNFGVNKEIRRIFTVFCVALPIAIPLIAVSSTATGGDQSKGVYVVLTVMFDAIFIVSGLMPLLHQLKIERKVAESDFGELDNFERVLFEDAAAFVAFKQFLAREFSAEVLEFYEAVGRYQRMYSVSTPTQQRAMAQIIHSQYLARNAPTQVNISVVCSDKINVALFGRSDAAAQSGSAELKIAPRQVFDEAQTEMLKLMRHGPFFRFQNSKKKKKAKKTRKVKAKSGALLASTPTSDKSKDHEILAKINNPV